MTSAPQVLALGALAPQAIATLRDRHRCAHLARPEAASSFLATTDLTSVEVLVIRSPFKADQALIDRLPKLQAVVRAGAGVDNIDVDLLRTRGVELVRCRGSAASVVELLVSQVVCLLRRTPAEVAAAKVATAGWHKADHMGRSLAEVRSLVIGFGEIGRLYTSVVTRLGGPVVAVDHHADDPDKQLAARDLGCRLLDRPDDEWRHSEVIVLCCPLTETTRGLVGPAVVRQLPALAIVANIGRGELWDLRSIASGVQSGALAGAYLDSLDSEPVYDPALTAHPNVIATRHIGAQTTAAVARIGDELVAAVNAYLTSN